MGAAVGRKTERAEREQRLAASQQERKRHPEHTPSPDPELLSEMASSHAFEIEANMREAYGADKAMTQWAATARTERPGRDMRARAPASDHRVPQDTSQVAMGHSPSDPRVPGAPGQHLEFQPNLRPAPGADVASVSGVPGPLARAVTSHNHVVSLNFADGSNGHLGRQLGDRDPSGVHGAARNMPEGTSGNYPGQATGQAPLPQTPRHPGFAIDANSRPWGDRDLPRGFHPPAEVRRRL